MRHTAATLALAFAAAPLLAQDHAVPRGGGSSGGGSSSSGAEHHSSGSSSSSGSSGSSYSGSSSSSASGAEQRHPRAGTGTGNRYRGGYGGSYGGGYYSGYYPWYPWYYPSSYSWGPYWGSYYYGYWPQGAYYTGGGYDRRSYRSSNHESGAIRVLVDPEDAKVYVDGYYAGTVDDFDGFTQRLYLSGGPHEILLKREGYKSLRFRVYVVPGETIKIENDMDKGQGEEALQDLTHGRGDAPDDRYAPEPRGSGREDRDRDEDIDEAPQPQPRRPMRDDAGIDVRRGGARGALDLRVSPGDASVYVDGEFRGAAKQIRSLELPTGSHRVEIVRPGYETFHREIEIGSGRSEELQVTLEQR